MGTLSWIALGAFSLLWGCAVDDRQVSVDPLSTAPSNAGPDAAGGPVAPEASGDPELTDPAVSDDAGSGLIPGDGCVECEPACLAAETRCASPTELTECGADGVWAEAARCPFACVEGGCGGECSPASTECVTTTRQRQCSDVGVWSEPQDCENACVGSACAGQCRPGATRCLSATEVETCTEQGEWGAATVCENACSGSACTGECSPDETRCFSDSQLQTCGGEGQWQTPTACPLACVGSSCGGDCSPGSRRCNAATGRPQLCNAGVWEDQSACPFVCIGSGTCGGECTPGSRRCNPVSGVPQLCSGLGSWQNQAACATCQQCGGNAQCQPVIEAEDPGSCDGQNSCDQAGVCRVKVVAVATGNNGCVVLADGAVRCWGSGSHGAPEPYTARWQDAEARATRLRFTGRRAIDVMGNDYHYCALLDDGSARCWGSGFYGQLGQGSAEDIGDDADEPPDTYTRIAFASPIAQLSIGGDTSCARLANGSVRCWGRSVWMGVPLASDQYVGDESHELPSTFPELAFGEAVVDLATGNNHRCAVLQSGSMKCWGSGLYGALGNGGTAIVGGPTVPPPASFPTISYAGGIAAAALSSTGSCAVLRGSTTLRCWGRWVNAGVDDFIGDTPAETPAQFLSFSFGEALSQVDGGYTTFCGLDAGGRAVCWGSGNLGQLGNGSTDFVGDSPLETPATFPRIQFGSPITSIDLDFQGGGACAVLASGSLRCWGAGFGPSEANFNLGDDELAADAAPYIPIRPRAGD